MTFNDDVDTLSDNRSDVENIHTCHPKITFCLKNRKKNSQLPANIQFSELCYQKFRCRDAEVSVGRRHFSTNQWTNNLLTEIKTFRSLAQRNEFQPETSHVASSHPHLEKFHVARNRFWTEKKHLRSLTWHAEMRQENTKKFASSKIIHKIYVFASWCFPTPSHGIINPIN